MCLKNDGISDQTLAVPGVQHSFSGVVVHHGVVAVLIGELNVGVPWTSSLGVISKVDGCGLWVIAVDTVNHSTGHKRISHWTHPLWNNKTQLKSEDNKTVCPLVAYIHSDDADLRNRITFHFKMDGIGTDWQVTGIGLENINASNNATELLFRYWIFHDVFA